MINKKFIIRMQLTIGVYCREKNNYDKPQPYKSQIVCNNKHNYFSSSQIAREFCWKLTFGLLERKYKSNMAELRMTVNEREYK